MIVKERNGNRVFEKITRWNVLEDTIVSPKNRFAAYADNADSGNNKLFLTAFTVRGKILPFNRFKKLETPILLEDMSNLVRYDEETGYYMEVNNEDRKIRIWEARLSK